MNRVVKLSLVAALETAKAIASFKGNTLVIGAGTNVNVGK